MGCFKRLKVYLGSFYGNVLVYVIVELLSSLQRKLVSTNIYSSIPNSIYLCKRMMSLELLPNLLQNLFVGERPFCKKLELGLLHFLDVFVKEIFGKQIRV